MSSLLNHARKVLRTTALRSKTMLLVEEAYRVLKDTHPMTLRQLYYQLVSRQIIPNHKGSYKKLGHAVVEARKQRYIPWDWIEDRLRKPRAVSMWKDVPAFAEAAIQAYRRNVWPSQPQYLEVWLEKDALSGIFEDELTGYGVTLNVGRGYDGWSSVYEAARRYANLEKPVKILYFGDFDPSGENMTASLRKRLFELGVRPDMKRIAILKEDIALYNLPPDFAKRSDSRAQNFIARYGDEAVELDALPPAVLRERLIENVEANLDLDQLRQVQEQEEQERRRIETALGRIR